MKIPNGPKGTVAEGLPTLYTTRLRSYGAAGFRLQNQEEMQGCPAQYKARYVDWRVTAQKRASNLTFGSLIHDVLFLMESEPIGPQEALERLWPVDLSMDHWREAVDLLDSYMERGGPMARYGTLGVELELFAELYVDEDFGPVMFGGHIDWLGVDLDDPSVLHLSDYKTNQQPISVEDVKGDIQLMSYDWLVRQNWQRLGLAGRPQVVVHLDAIRYRDVEWRFQEMELDEWQEWATAIARKILRDDEAKEVLNPYCGWCPIKLECQTYMNLPGEASTMLEARTGKALPELVSWMDEAKQAVKILNAGIGEIESDLKTIAEVNGEVIVGQHRWVSEVAEKKELDKTRLREVIGDEAFEALAGFTQKALNEYVRARPELKSAVEACWSKEPSGMTVARKKVESD